MAFKPAYREQVRLRLALMGLPGTGKTMSSLATAASISYEIRKRGGEGRIAVADSEQESAKLYAMSRAERRKYDAMSIDAGYEYIKQIRKYPIDVAVLAPPFSPLSYIGIIQDAAKEGYDITVLDSISHAWAGTGGALDRKGKEEDRGANSWTAWRKITPEHTAFVDAMLSTPSHLIVTMRMKAVHAMETGKDGKTKIVDLGNEEIQREGVRYEFTLVGQIDQNHEMEIVKTRLDGVIAMGEKFLKPGDAFGRKLYGWVNDGDDPAPRVEVPPPMVVAASPAEVTLLDRIDSASTLPDLQSLASELTSAAKSGTVPQATLDEIKRRYVARKVYLTQGAAKLAALMESEIAAIAADKAKVDAADEHGYAKPGTETVNIAGIEVPAVNGDDQ